MGIELVDGQANAATMGHDPGVPDRGIGVGEPDVAADRGSSPATEGWPHPAAGKASRNCGDYPPWFRAAV
jgi:hypothetical protein